MISIDVVATIREAISVLLLLLLFAIIILMYIGIHGSTTDIITVMAILLLVNSLNSVHVYV